MHRRRERDVIGVVGGLAVLVASGAIARRGVGGTEERIFRVVNGLPGGAFRAVWIPMQYGTLGSAPALAAVALARRRGRFAVALLGAGSAAWIMAKVVKPVVARGRPGSSLENAVIRGTEEGDQGFPSGHAAVSAALTVVTLPYVSDRWRPLPLALAGFVPVARVFVGAHLPLDAIGGSALGVAVGGVINLCLGVPDRRRADRQT